MSTGDKNGVDVQSDLKISKDGNAVAWVSLGAYAGTPGTDAEVPYVGRRDADGNWAVSSYFPRLSGTFRPDFFSYLGAYAFSDDLRAMTFITNGSVDGEDRDLTVTPFGTFAQLDVYRTTGGGTAEWASRAVSGPPPNEIVDAKLLGVSPDGSSSFFATSEALSPDVVAGTGIQHLYRYRNGAVELVGVDETGALLAGGSQLGTGLTFAFPSTGNAGDLPDSEAVSDDGEAFVYVGTPNGLQNQLYLHRADGAVARISSSQRAGSAGDPSTTPAAFVGATPDLGIVYFRSADQLTDDAPAGGGDYAYDTATGRLSFSNVDDVLTGNFGGGFVRASDDGRYVYFVSVQDLAPGATANDANLYVRSPDGIEFISPVSLNDSSLYISSSTAIVPSYSQSYLDATGTKFVYQTVANATARDTLGRSQVYLYDANASGERVTCISCDPNTTTTTGDARLKSNSDYGRATPQSITADGSRIVFATEEGLDPHDTNGVQDVYEYVGGRAVLISSGTSGARSSIVDMSADGRDLYFLTRSSLTPEDTDSGLADVYDARLGAPRVQTTPPAPCEGDDCQKPPSVYAPTGTPGSETATGPGNVVPGNEPGFTVGSISSSAAKKFARSGQLPLSVKVVGAGRVSASAFAFVKGLDARVAAASKSASRTSTVRLTLRLSRAAQQQLTSKGKLKVRLTVTFSAVKGSVTKSVTLRAAKRARSGKAQKTTTSKGR